MSHSAPSLLRIAIFLVILPSILCQCSPKNEEIEVSDLTQKEQLGKLLFFEESLSTPEGQSCATCHDPAVGFADPLTELPVSRGAVHGLYGNRNDMPVSYSMYVPALNYDSIEEVWLGGLFWDGRANSLTEQAMGPPLNPLEMANRDTALLAVKIRSLDYSDRFVEIYGDHALNDPDSAFFYMADALAAYERSKEVNPFSSKFDLWQRGESALTEQEQRGFMLFVVESKGNCSACHPHTPLEDGTPALFTDFTYDNLGTPANGESPFLLLSSEHNPEGFNYRDPGLAETLGDPSELGKFRVPTLRNVAITPPYMHNGVFKTLYQVVAFYNTRDLAPWPEPEISANLNVDEMGNLGLTNQEVEDIVAFLKTLTDGWSDTD
jgi:cytochrome c peroxidase